MCMPPSRILRTMVRVEAAGQSYEQVQSFTYLGGAVTETPDMSIEIARRTRACWMRIRRYLRELYDQPKVALSLKTRMIKAKATEALLDGCSTWTLRQGHYAKLRAVHHRVLLRIIGALRIRPDHRITSYNRALGLSFGRRRIRWISVRLSSSPLSVVRKAIVKSAMSRARSACVYGSSVQYRRARIGITKARR